MHNIKIYKKPQIPKTTRKTRSQTANESTTTTTTNESLSSDDSISNDTLSALVKKSRDLSHLQKNLLTKSRTRERQTKSTWNNLFLKLITYICNKVLFCIGSNLWSSNLVSSFFWSSNLVGSFLWSSNLVIGRCFYCHLSRFNIYYVTMYLVDKINHAVEIKFNWFFC